MMKYHSITLVILAGWGKWNEMSRKMAIADITSLTCDPSDGAVEVGSDET